MASLLPPFSSYVDDITLSSPTTLRSQQHILAFKQDKKFEKFEDSLTLRNAIQYRVALFKDDVGHLGVSCTEDQKETESLHQKVEVDKDKKGAMASASMIATQGGKRCAFEGCHKLVLPDPNTGKVDMAEHVRGSLNHRFNDGRQSCSECGKVFNGDLQGCHDLCKHSFTEHPQLAPPLHLPCNVPGTLCQEKFASTSEREHHIALRHPFSVVSPSPNPPPPSINNPAHPDHPDHVPNPLRNQHPPSSARRLPSPSSHPRLYPPHPESGPSEQQHQAGPSQHYSQSGLSHQLPHPGTPAQGPQSDPPGSERLYHMSDFELSPAHPAPPRPQPPSEAGPSSQGRQGQQRGRDSGGRDRMFGGMFGKDKGKGKGRR